jgi:uncharacterized protein YprB with RNaseH-like and TPR domain
MAVLNVEISTENLLRAVTQMPETEFNQFIEKARKLRRQPTKPKWAKDEIELIKKINECALSEEKQSRYDELVEKRRDEKITESELQELSALIDEAEELNVRRLENVVKLALSSKKSVDEIMEELELYPPPVI